ncbi:MAG: restriction endonuclease [Polyangiaceae bacterium]|nr:restriction endonuclease [Polyangiaceae bacterium]
MQLLERVFEMKGGYVLDFSDRSYTQFFRDELSINIDDAKYALDGSSKAKRLRYFLQNEARLTVAKTVKALWEYRESVRELGGKAETVLNASQKVAELVQTLGGNWEGAAQLATPAPVAVDLSVVDALKRRLTALTSVAPHQRGYDFERFLKDLFNAYHLEARDPFRIVGEQIDGSFQLDGATYLLEAKWQNSKSNAAELRAFNGKIEEKVVWARGLFVSYCGFSEEGLAAFGKGKRLICMDGFDMHEALERSISVSKLLQDKAREAATSGRVFVPVRYLYPV